MNEKSARSVESLRPTLWRTCRALANYCRLRLLGELIRRPGQSVSQIAVRLRLPVPLVSQYLRALNARGLLAARRSGREVEYTPAANASVPQAGILLAALRRTFHQSDPTGTVFRLATAFTHPRRVAIAEVLAKGPLGTAELYRTIGMSPAALKRHMKKLRARGLVVATANGYALARPTSALASALLTLVRTST